MLDLDSVMSPMSPAFGLQQPRKQMKMGMFPGSSTVEHSAVNRRVASSNLARGAKLTVYPALHHALTATASNGAFSGFRPFRPITRILAGISKPSPALSAHSLRSPRSAATLSYRSDMVSPVRTEPLAS